MNFLHFKGKKLPAFIHAVNNFDNCLATVILIWPFQDRDLLVSSRKFLEVYFMLIIVLSKKVLKIFRWNFSFAWKHFFDLLVINDTLFVCSQLVTFCNSVLTISKGDCKFGD